MQNATSAGSEGEDPTRGTTRPPWVPFACQRESDPVGTIGHKSRWYGPVSADTERHDLTVPAAPGNAETPGIAAFSAAHQGLRFWHPQRDSNPCRHLESDPWADLYGW